MKSKVVRRLLSIAHPSMSQISLNLMHRLLSNFGTYARMFIECLIKKLAGRGGIFLALLDYVSRAHEIEICLSVVHPSMAQLSLNLMHRFLSNFGCCFP